MESGMTKEQERHSQERSVGESFLDFLDVLLRYKRFITYFVFVVTLAGALAAALSPKWYKSTASVFPAEKADLFGGLEGIASLAKSFSPAKALSSLGSNPELDRYTAILNSGRVIGAVIEKFDLVHVYDISSYPQEKTAKELLSNTEITVQPEGNLTVAVYDRDPQRAADMANYFVEMLNKVNSEMQVQNAHGNRVFIEERYRKNLTDLRTAEDSLRNFQKQYGVIAVPEQAQASIKGAAELVGHLALKEIQVGVLRRTLSDDNPSVDAAQAEVEETRKKLSELNTGVGMSSGEKSVFVPLANVPDLGAEYVRRFREVEIQYKILQFITPLYEQAKVEERRETPSVIVLDRAGPAERKAKPKIAIWGGIALASSLMLALLGVFAMEGIHSLKAAHPGRVENIFARFKRGWFRSQSPR
jgi:tyrosine-protein kinase Etk/Wzc